MFCCRGQDETGGLDRGVQREKRGLLIIFYFYKIPFLNEIGQKTHRSSLNILGVLFFFFLPFSFKTETTFSRPVSSTIDPPASAPH